MAAAFEGCQWRSIRWYIAGIPGVLVSARILKNQLEGLRKRLQFGAYTADGTTHLHKCIGESVSYLVEVFNDYFRYSGVERQALEGKSVLEIGSGDSLGMSLLLAGVGAKQVVSIDRFRPYRDPRKELQLLGTLVETATGVTKQRMMRSFVSDKGITGDTIRYVPELSIEKAVNELGETQFDYIVSRSVLEHVLDINESYASCRALIRKGGLMIHKVDLSNHSSIERHPLQFLTYSWRLWKLMSSNIGRINRARWSQHQTALEHNGFVVERFDVTKRLGVAEVQSIRQRLKPPFCHMTDEELSICGFYVVCRAV